jgi:hypothetical protein
LQSDLLALGFSRDYERCRVRVHELAAPLSDAAFWTKPFGFGNSFGPSGSASDGQSQLLPGRAGRRHRLRPHARSRIHRDRAAAEGRGFRDFDVAVAMVLRTIAEQREEDWAAAYSGVGEPDAHNRFDIFLKCAMHFYHHVGQMVYLQRQLCNSS